MTDIELVELSKQPILAIRTRTSLEDLPKVISASYSKLMAYMDELGEPPTFAPFTAYYNQDLRDLEVEMGFPVAKILPDKDEIHSSFIPAGKAATCMHEGPYSEMKMTYRDLFIWADKNGYEPVGVFYEYYFSKPEVPENAHVTKIVMPLK